MTFAHFVKEHYDEVKHLPNKERLKALSVIYKKQNGGSPSESRPQKSRTKRVDGGVFGNFQNGAVARLKGGSLARALAVKQKEVLHSSVPKNLYHVGTSVPSTLPYEQHMY